MAACAKAMFFNVHKPTKNQLRSFDMGSPSPEHQKPECLS